jgi:hypothetical protein
MGSIRARGKGDEYGNGVKSLGSGPWTFATRLGLGAGLGAGLASVVAGAGAGAGAKVI